MKLEHIQFFCDVVEIGSISQAANNSFISQQGMSMALKQIESELGITLFHRTNKGVNLTEDGEQFHKCAMGMLELYNDFLNEMHSPADNSTFNVYISNSMYKMFSIMNQAPFMRRNDWYFSYTERPPKEVVRLINENKGIAFFSTHGASQHGLLEEVSPEHRIYNVGHEDKVVYICHRDSPILQYSEEQWRDLLSKKVLRCILSSSEQDLKSFMRKMPKVVCLPDLEGHKAALRQPNTFSIINYKTYRLHFDPTEFVVFHKKQMQKSVQYYVAFNLKESEVNNKMEYELVRYLEEMLASEDEF